MVSVIIPTIGRETLTRTIESVLNQTYKDIEIIIVQDGMKNGTPTTVFSGDKVLILADNSGFHAKPRNMGLRIAEGEYACYIDDDDEMLPTSIEDRVKAIESGDFDFSYGKRKYLNDARVGTMESAHFEWRNEDADKPFWLGTCDILHKTEMLFELGGWNEDLIRYGDYELGARIGRAGYKGKAIDKVLTHCYSVDNQMSFRKGHKTAEEILENLTINQEWLE